EARLSRMEQGGSAVKDFAEGKCQQSNGLSAHDNKHELLSHRPASVRRAWIAQWRSFEPLTAKAAGIWMKQNLGLQGLPYRGGGARQARLGAVQPSARAQRDLGGRTRWPDTGLRGFHDGSAETNAGIERNPRSREISVHQYGVGPGGHLPRSGDD